MIPRGRWYLCITPATWIDRILEDGSGPRIDESAVLFVYARRKSRARALALRAWKRLGRGNGKPDFLADDGNPFAAIKVERVNESLEAVA